MKIDLPYDFGEIVYLKIRSERVKGMVTGYYINHSTLMIAITWADTLHEIHHYPFELTKEFTLDYENE